MIEAALIALALGSAQVATPVPEILSYELRLVVRTENNAVEGGAIKGNAKVVLSARGGALDSVRFSLNEALSIDALRDGKRALKAERGAKLAEGRAWTVQLVPPLKAGERRTLEFDYSGHGTDPGPKDPDWPGVLLVRDDEIRMSHEAQWYPVVPLDDRARATLAAPTTLELVLPRDMESLGPGELMSSELTESTRTDRWVSSRAVRSSIVAGRYKRQLAVSQGLTVHMLAFDGHETGARRWGEEAARIAEVFRNLYGDLGSKTYGLVEMRVRDEAQTYDYAADGFSVFDSVLFDDAFFRGHAPDSRKLARNLAYVYLGGSVDPHGFGERFLVESLAAAASFVYLEEGEGELAAIAAAKDANELYFRDPGDELPVAVTDSSSPRYSQVISGKGALALRTLRYWAGPKEFDRALRNWLQACRAGTLVPSFGSFIKELRAVLDTAVDDWANEWLHRLGAPQYSLEFELEPAGGKLTRVSGYLSQSGELYTNPVELGLISASGRTSLIVIRPRDRRMKFEAVVSQDIERVTIDPRYLLLFDRR